MDICSILNVMRTISNPERKLDKCIKSVTVEEKEDHEVKEKTDESSELVEEMNKDILNDIPYIPYHDLAIIFKIAFDVRKDQVATSLIRNDHLIMWGITLKDIAAVAMQNTEQLFPIVFRPMDDIIKQITGEEIEVNDMMYVLTNQQWLNGAITMLYSNCLKNVGNLLKENFYLIPSSIHEMIVVRESGVEGIEYLNAMIREVNASEVNPEEVLADRAYYYDRKTETVSDC